MHSRAKARANRDRATRLNTDWGVNAVQARYSDTGHWYAALERFPAALFDPGGYVSFATEAEYRAAPMSIGKQVSIPKPGISAMPGYVRVSGSDAPPVSPQAQDLEAPPPERVSTTVSRIVRDTLLARRVKAMHNNECQVCGGTLILPDGSRYSEGHHIHPLGAPHNGPDVRENIVCLCPNHHAAFDLGAIRLVLAELRQVPGHRVGQQYIDYHNSTIYGRA